jgi:ketosteroid isomerase-like protein
MSDANVEIVRRYYTVLDDVLRRYWEAPDTPFAESPLVDEVLPLLQADAEWDAMHREEPYRGHEEALRGVEDWLEAGEEWRVQIEELTEAGEDQVLAVLRVSIRGRGSQVSVDQRIFTVVRVGEEKISRIADYTERRDALEAAGLSE